MFHHKQIDAFRYKHHRQVYALFRIAIGLLFAQHGVQKLFGIFGGTAAEPFSLMWVAGVVETFGGILIAVGLLTTIAAAVSGIEMLVAYVMAHASNGLVPIVNKGELALVYFACFAFIVFYGPSVWSMDGATCKDCAK